MYTVIKCKQVKTFFNILQELCKYVNKLVPRKYFTLVRIIVWLRNKTSDTHLTQGKVIIIAESLSKHLTFENHTAKS